MIQPPGKASHDKLKVAVIRRGTTLYRISHFGHPSPAFFDKGQSGRFNSPAGEYGVCYMADTLDAAFAESLGHSVSDRFAPSQTKIITESDLDVYHVYQFEVEATLHVGELCGPGLPLLNLDNNISTSPKPYSRPHEWSLWIYNHPQNLDGIRYHSRHLPDNRCEALFDRAASKLSHRDLGSLIDWTCPKTGKDIWDLLEEHGWDTF